MHRRPGLERALEAQGQDAHDAASATAAAIRLASALTQLGQRLDGRGAVDRHAAGGERSPLALEAVGAAEVLGVCRKPGHAGRDDVCAGVGPHRIDEGVGVAYRHMGVTHLDEDGVGQVVGGERVLLA